MSDTVIKVEHLGKRHTLTHEQRERYTALRDVLTQGAKRLTHPILCPVSSLLVPGRRQTSEDKNLTSFVSRDPEAVCVMIPVRLKIEKLIMNKSCTEGASCFWNT
jgi:hypothetical protein